MTRYLATTALLLAAPVAAQQPLTRIADRATFVERLAGEDLTRTGITVRIVPEGTIQGRAFGAAVNGSWHWTDGLFCREMSWTARSWPMNCQAVYLGENMVRFVADRGQGDAVDLTIN